MKNYKKPLLFGLVLLGALMICSVINIDGDAINNFVAGVVDIRV